MIKEAYCSYEISKLLKEKGFPQEYDIYHSMVYNEENYEDEYEVQRMVLETRPVKAGTLSSYPIGVPEPKCYCPTHQMACAWLREVKSINIFILPLRKGYTYSLYNNTGALTLKEIREYSTYENATEEAIKYVLENLL